MTGVAALALCAGISSCSKGDELYDQSVIDGQKVESINEQYAAAFEKAFGKVGPNVDWGFGSRASTRASNGDTYPETSTGINANANEWADPNAEFGGWVVPDPLTDGQKKRVIAYFQANPNLTFSDPHLRHFFVQQVYKGGTAQAGASNENIVAANNTTYDSSHMDLLTVGNNNQHINNYNSGNCSTNSQVLDNGGNVNSGPYHSDQIMLMVNIGDTSCFGYHESGSSTHHNNKAALVAASVIDDWAAQNGNPGEAVDDKWHRSFLGFDLALKEGAEAQSNVAVKYNDGPESYSYALVNGNVVSVNGNDNIVFNNKNIYYLDTNTNMYVAADKKTISDGEIQAEYRVNGQYMGKYINVDNLMALLNDGWLPVKDKNLREWVKVGKSDGYFSDWIVTLTKAERQETSTPPTPPATTTYRVIAEDLSAGGEESDFDFNDVIFDVEPNAAGNAADIVLVAAGGTYRLEVAGVEVHGAFGCSADEKGLYPMINTGDGPQKSTVKIKTISGNFSTDEAIRQSIKNISIIVWKPRGKDTKDVVACTIDATTGAPAGKILVDKNFGIVPEHHSIANEHSHFRTYVRGSFDGDTWW